MKQKLRNFLLNISDENIERLVEIAVTGFVSLFFLFYAIAEKKYIEAILIMIARSLWRIEIILLNKKSQKDYL
jgi:hypothetical protein